MILSSFLRSGQFINRVISTSTDFLFLASTYISLLSVFSSSSGLRRITFVGSSGPLSGGWFPKELKGTKELPEDLDELLKKK